MIASRYVAIHNAREYAKRCNEAVLIWIVREDGQTGYELYLESDFWMAGFNRHPDYYVEPDGTISC